jgi:peptidoglycan biosynthesis protein MviN/MurJ (putative lipid II flippase)
LTWGAPGLALANAAAVSLEAGGLLLVARRRLGGLEEGRFGAALVRVVAATLIMSLVLFALLRSPAGTAHPVAALGAGLLAGLVYLGAVLALGLEEGRALLAMARHRVRSLLPVPAQPGA